MELSVVNSQAIGVQLILVFFNTVVITALLSAFALWRYRRSVLIGMQGQAGEALSLPIVPAPPRERDTRDPRVTDALAWERAAHRRVARTYILSVAAGALPLAWIYLTQSGLPRSPAHVLMVAGAMLCAAVPMVAVSLAWSWKRGALSALVMLLAGAVAMTLASMLQRPFYGGRPSADQLYNFVLFFGMAGPLLAVPLLFLLGSGSSRVRGVVPTIFGGLIVFGAAPLAGSWLAITLAGTSAGLGFMLATVSSLGLYAPFLLLTLPIGFIAWIRLHRVANAYSTKRFSDTQLLARMWWLMFVADVAFSLINSGEGPIAFTLVGCVIAYLIFPLANHWLFAHSGLARGRPAPRTLLLLRTFGFRARTERLFDRIGSRWRYFGPVSMIAAPDVVARTLDPGDFLEWLTGRVDESFVRSRSDLERRLAGFDAIPDPDGRYRVNELCCRNDTWQATVVSLMDSADAIVMDLRGLDAGHSGCEFELQQLATRVDAKRVVLVVDRNTDREMLMRAAGSTSGNWQIVTFDRGTVYETDKLFEELLRAAA